MQVDCHTRAYRDDTGTAEAERGLAADGLQQYRLAQAAPCDLRSREI